MGAWAYHPRHLTNERKQQGGRKAAGRMAGGAEGRKDRKAILNPTDHLQGAPTRSHQVRDADPLPNVSSALPAHPMISI